MEDAKKQFAAQLREAMQAAGYELGVLEREFNTSHWGQADVAGWRALEVA